MEIVYNENFFNTQLPNDGNMAGLFDSLIGAAVGGVTSIFGGGGGSKSGQAKGLKEITAFVNQAIATLNEIGSRLGGGTLTPDQAIFEAQRIEATLSNPTFVFQAKNGDDAAVLRNGKMQAAGLVAQIRTAADQQKMAIAAQMAAANQPSGVTLFGGLDTQTLLIAGAAGLGLILLLRQ